MGVKQVSFNYVQKGLHEMPVNDISEKALVFNLTDISKTRSIQHTLCWANIRTLCCPTLMAPSELEASTPIPHSSRISWRATSLGECCSLWSSEIMSEVAGKSSGKMNANDSGTFSPMTSNGWLQSFRRYLSAWNMEHNTYITSLITA